MMKEMVQFLIANINAVKALSTFIINLAKNLKLTFSLSLIVNFVEFLLPSIQSFVEAVKQLL